ncbi:hypothetical protein K431DRAFT_135968 [Polychaeton citri CBS 116435]|uniref:Uncharacterized protein n=1 Tax=Polychaeton citri CBS 116435 TaxID=1314669 RepID=A0A9P4Q2C9_9PEZI|nr:hypothetical protein K431DRAFT_135968 [Polychaeton citri CBS 116435]
MREPYLTIAEPDDRYRRFLLMLVLFSFLFFRAEKPWPAMSVTSSSDRGKTCSLRWAVGPPPPQKQPGALFCTCNAILVQIKPCYVVLSTSPNHYTTAHVI